MIILILLRTNSVAFFQEKLNDVWIHKGVGSVTEINDVVRFASAKTFNHLLNFSCYCVFRAIHNTRVQIALQGNTLVLVDLDSFSWVPGPVQ